MEVGAATLAAVLAALGDDPHPVLSRAPAATVRKAEALAVPGGEPVAPAPPPGRHWGYAVQLYSLRSAGSWGHGDLHDLADLAAWSGRALGAGFVLVNPLHAAEPAPPVSPSPYLPMTRHFVSPLYLRIEDLPEYRALPPADRALVEALGRPLRARNRTAALIDRDAVWQAKRAALEIIHAQPAPAGRPAAFERFRVAGGQPLADWSAWCALAEQHGPDWRAWPPPLRDARGGAVAAERDRLRARTRFHEWLQWLADEQGAAAQAAARAAGMPIGIIADLAVGVSPGGADAWAGGGLLVAGMSAGAPPDEFNQRGQDWNQPPWHPGRLAAAGYQPLAGLIRSGFRHAGGLRADHVMGLFRIWWIPAGMTPDQGTYVRYDHAATTGVLAAEAAQACATAIGEDLGTVEDWVRDYLAARGVLGTAMLWFERDAAGRPLPPARWRRDCLATVGTHDVPPAAAFATGDQVTLRDRLGLLTRPLASEREAARKSVAAWADAVAGQGLLPAGSAAELDPDVFTVALYGYLARTPARLIAVSLADATGERRPQNVPGTTDEHPNWRLPLCDATGRPVLLEDLDALPVVHAIARAVTPVPPGGPGRSGTGGR